MESGRGRSAAERDPRKLAIQLRSGAPEAFRELRRRVRRILRFRGYRMSGEERNDLEQEIMIQVWQAVNRSGFDPGGGFWGFVEVVTVRRTIDWLRTRRLFGGLDETMRQPGPGPLRTLLAGERVRLARAAVERLGGSCRELIELHFGERLPYGELSRRFGKSEGALRVQMYRCIRRVRAIVDEMSAAAAADDSTVEGV